jgi:hypothetical protein
MKRSSEITEGSTEFRAFDTLMAKLIAVPKAEILRREAEYKKQADENPSKPGPRKKQSA